MARFFEGVNPAGNEFDDELSLGRIRGGTAVHVRGRATVSGSLVEIWGPATQYTFPSSLATVSVSSSDATDAWTDNGARSVMIDGCGAGYERYQEVLILSGTSIAVTTGSYIRVNHIYAKDVGSHQSNRGQVSAYHSGTLLISQIASGSGEDGNGIYTVPSGSMAVVRAGYFYSAIDAAVQARVQVRPGGSGSAWQNVINGEVYRSEANLRFVAPMFPAKSDLRFSAAITKAGSVSAGTIAAGCFLVVFDQTYNDQEPK